MPQASVVYPQSTIPQQSVSLPITFTQDESIDQAFIKLSASVTDLIKNANFPSLQRACIEKAKTPKMLLKSNEIVPVIKEAQSFQTLCSMLADTTYWNFLDIRMMEAMATASMIPAAQEGIDNFKKAFFSMTLKEAAPYFTVVPVKSGYTTMYEVLDRDPSQMTIGELHKHRFYLETEVVQNGPDTCTICSIKIGSVTIVWQIHIDHIHQAYSSIQSKMRSQLSLQAISYLSIPEAAFLEAKLPLLLRGQEVQQIGPFEQSTKNRSKSKHPLPKGYEWCSVNHDNYQQIASTCIDFTLLLDYLKWVISHPQFQNQFLFGIKDSLSKKVVSIAFSIPYNIIIGGKVLPSLLVGMSLNRSEFPRLCKEDVEVKFWIASCKKLMNDVQLFNISQVVVRSGPYDILQPVLACDIRTCSLSNSIPYNSLRTPGLRRIRPEDIPRALAFTNQYTSQYKIGQVFQSEEEFSHWFLCPSIPDHVTTYVVEDPVSGNITDMFSFRCVHLIIIVQAVITTKSPIKEIVKDLLLCLKQQGVIYFAFSMPEIEKYMPAVESYETCCYYWYNYQHPEVNEDECCLFRFGLF